MEWSAVPLRQGKDRGKAGLSFSSYLHFEKSSTERIINRLLNS